MSGATFHPVVIGRSPSVAQDFVALAEATNDRLDAIQAAFNNHAHSVPVLGTSGGPIPTAPPPSPPVTIPMVGSADVGSSKVKAEV
jgi:hypothetical protein